MTTTPTLLAKLARSAIAADIGNVNTKFRRQGDLRPPQVGAQQAVHQRGHPGAPMTPGATG